MERWFTDYWKCLVLDFSVMGNMLFFWFKKLMERWYLLVIEKLLFWTFQWWEMLSFFQTKCWRKDDIYMVFLSFLWYSRTRERWFFRTVRQLVYTIFITNNCVSFHLRWKKNLVKHQNASKYYENYFSYLSFNLIRFRVKRSISC